MGVTLGDISISASFEAENVNIVSISRDGRIASIVYVDASGLLKVSKLDVFEGGNSFTKIANSAIVN